MAFEAGTVPTAEDFTFLVNRVVDRAERTSSSSTTTTELAVLRLDDVPLVGGRTYRISSSGLILDSSVNGDACAARYRATFDGSTPTTSSTLFGGALEHVSVSSGQATPCILRWYHPSTDETLSILLSVVRASGTGNVSIIAATGFPIDIVVEDCGPTVTDTGVDL